MAQAPLDIEGIRATSAPDGGAQATTQTAALADIFHLMGDKSRLSILLLVLDASRPVGEIAAATGLSPSLVSHHLRLLRAGRLVRAERRGKQVFYEVDDGHIRRVLTDMRDHLAEGGSPPLSPPLARAKGG
jgi:ArsR family transcriptional regulator